MTERTANYTQILKIKKKEVARTQSCSFFFRQKRNATVSFEFLFHDTEIYKTMTPANPAATKDKKEDDGKQEGIPSTQQQSKLQM